jgi:hypothetical protein
MRGRIMLADYKIPALPNDDAISHDNSAVALISLAHGLVA